VKKSDVVKAPFLLNLLLFLTFDLMLLGAGVRTMDAGLTCPDWPLCFGKTIPEYHFGVYLEFIHRVIAGIVGVLYMIFFFQVWMKPELKKIRLLSLVGLFFLIAQIIMGGLTVLKVLDAYIVTMHLTLATVFLLSLLFMKRKLTYDISEVSLLKPNRTSRLFRISLVFGMVFVVVQIVLGGLVAATYSGLVCIDFPTCNGQWVPALSGPIGIQVIHRFGAYWLTLVIATIFGFSIFGAKKMGLKRSHRKMGVMLFYLVMTQIFVGVMNLKYLMPAFLSVLHLGIALVILITMVNYYYKSRISTQ
jgi:cytochrome c oxidase assembly protein subunit 15